MLHFVFRLPFDKRERQPENVLTTRFQAAFMVYGERSRQLIQHRPQPAQQQKHRQRQRNRVIAQRQDIAAQ